jgi:aspartate kinase
VPDQPGVSHRVFDAVAARNIVVDMIAQNVGISGKAAIGFTVPMNDLRPTREALEPLAREWGARIETEAEVSKVSIVGAGMRTTPGVADRMFAAFAARKINMKMITTADIKVSVLIDRNDGVEALRAVHQAFNLAAPRPGAGEPTPGPAHHASTGNEMTALTDRLANMEGILVTEVNLSTDQGRITLFGLPDRPGVSHRIFEAVASGKISVDMILQNLAGGHPELSFSVPQDELSRALELTRAAAKAITPDAEVTAEPSIATIDVIGVGMRTHTGVARKMFGALAKRGINIAMINTSEVRLSVVVDGTRGEEARDCLRQAFGVS